MFPCYESQEFRINSGVRIICYLDLLEKLSRNTKKKANKARRNQRVLGRSIDDRPKEIGTIESFGH